MNFWAKLSGSFHSKFFEAVKEGDLEKVKAQLKRNPDLVFDKDDAGWTPLHYAAHWNQKEVAALLLPNKADINAASIHGFKPLHVAAAQGYKDVVELLLANGAEINPKDHEGITPLHYAAEEGHSDVVQLLSNCLKTSIPTRP